MYEEVKKPCKEQKKMNSDSSLNIDSTFMSSIFLQSLLIPGYVMHPQDAHFETTAD